MYLTALKERFVLLAYRIIVKFRECKCDLADFKISVCTIFLGIFLDSYYVFKFQNID